MYPLMENLTRCDVDSHREQQESFAWLRFQSGSRTKVKWLEVPKIHDANKHTKLRTPSHLCEFGLINCGRGRVFRMLILETWLFHTTKEMNDPSTQNKWSCPSKSNNSSC